MNLTELRAEQALPGLRDWLSRLLEFAEEIIGGIKYFEEDHLGFMSLCFLCKQVDHAKSVILLIPSRDTVLISRSMIEGLVQLLWAENNPEVLPLKWRSFVHVHDWRVLQEKTRKGEVVEEVQHASIEEALNEFGEQFLKSKEKRIRESGGAMSDDPYHDNWRAGYGIREICENVEGENMYKNLYGPFSDWHHWGAGSLGGCLSRQDGCVAFSSQSSTESATALAVAFQCVLQTAESVERNLAPGFGLKLSKLKDEYLKWHQERGFG